MDIQQALDDLLANDPAMQQYITKFWFIPEGAPPPDCNYVVRLNSTAASDRYLTVGIVATPDLVVILEPLLALVAAQPPVDPSYPPSGSLAPGDGFDFSTATQWRGPEFTHWPVTTDITRLELGPTGVVVEFSKKNGTGRWPDVTPVGWDGPLQYSLGIAMHVGGQWHVTAPIQFWNALERAGGNVGDPGPTAGGIPGTIHGDWCYADAWGPMQRQPAPGETVGFFVVAGSVRGAGSDAVAVQERSNVVLVPFPTITGATFAR